MKFLMSIHGIKLHWEPKFMIKILDTIDKNDIVDGYEINGDFTDNVERNFMNNFIELIKYSNKIIQFHSPWDFSSKYKDFNYLKKGLSFYNSIAKVLKKNILLVIHPIDFPDKEIAEILTCRLLNNLLEISKKNNYKINFVLENLNVSNNPFRLNTTSVKHILNNIPNINFCWDIGHEVSEGICNYTISKDLLAKLENVHIHDININDHFPFYYEKTDFRRSLDYLHEINYKGAVVTEINLGILKGSNLKEKYEEYIENIGFLKNYYFGEQQCKLEKSISNI